MFCGKCGKSLPDGVKFCPYCGNPVEMPAAPVAPVEESVAPVEEPVVPVEEPVVPVEEPVAPVEEPVAPVEEPVIPVETPAQSIPTAAPAQSIPFAAPAAAPVQSFNQGSYQQPVANQYPAYAPAPAGKQKKVKSGKKSKAPVVIGIILAVIVALAVAAVFCWQSIARSILGEAGFYAWREAKTLNKIFAIDGIDKLKENKVVNANAKVKVKAEDGVYDKAFEAISADVNMSYDLNDNKAAAVVGLVAEDETKAEAYVSYEKGKLGISVPKLTDEKFYADFEIDDEETKLDLDYKTIGKELLKIYKEVDKGHLQTNTVVTKEVFDGKKCRNVTLTVKGDEAAELLVDVLTAVKDDETLINALDPAFKAAYESAGKFDSKKALDDEKEVSYEDYKKEFLDNFDDMIKEIKESVGDNDIVLTLSYASDSKGNIVNRRVVFVSDEDEVFNLVADSSIKGSNKTFNIYAASEENKTEILFNRIDSFIEITGKSVEMYKNEEDDGASFKATIDNLRVVDINNVFVLLGNFDVKITPISDGEEADYGITHIVLGLEELGNTYAVNANAQFGEYKYELKIESTLSSGTDFDKFEEPDKDALTDFNEFIDSMGDKFEEVAEDVLEDVDPALLLQLSKRAQIKDCEAREKLIEENLVKYIKTGNGGKAFKNVNDVISKQKAYDKMFDEGHPPYCTCGGSSGTKYEIYVYKDLTYSIRCRNTKCPNYGKGPSTKD